MIDKGPRGIEYLVETFFGGGDEAGAKRRHAAGAKGKGQEACETCRYTGTGLCIAAGGYLMFQRSRQAQHRGFLLGMAGGCVTLGIARWFA